MLFVTLSSESLLKIDSTLEVLFILFFSFSASFLFHYFWDASPAACLSYCYSSRSNFT